MSRKAEASLRRNIILAIIEERCGVLFLSYFLPSVLHPNHRSFAFSRE